MVFPADRDEQEEDRRDPVRDEWEEWFEVAEDEQIAEGDISVSETVSGHDPTPDLDDADKLDEFMHRVDEDELDEIP